MAGLIVGDKACEVRTIIETLKTSPVKVLLIKSLSSIALSLGISDETKDLMRRQLSRNEINSWEVLERYLKEWRMQEGEKARLQVFIEILKREDLNDFALRLTERFTTNTTQESDTTASTSTTSVPPQEMKARKTVTPEDLAKHIVSKKPLLIERALLSIQLISMFQSENILSRADTRYLEAENNRDRQNAMFFGFLEDRVVSNPDAYKFVANAFKDQCQDGVSSLLNEVFE